MTTPLISVVITTYNYGRFIEEAIESLIRKFNIGSAEIVQLKAVAS